MRRLPGGVVAFERGERARGEDGVKGGVSNQCRLSCAWNW